MAKCSKCQQDITRLNRRSNGGGGCRRIRDIERRSGHSRLHRSGRAWAITRKTVRGATRCRRGVERTTRTERLVVGGEVSDSY